MGDFTSTAPWYVRYRPQYPIELIDLLAVAAGLTASSRVLDLGAGPGHVAIPLAARVAEVVAVDVSAEMLVEIDAPNIRTVRALAEELDPAWGRFDLVTAGRSFHWFDHAVMFERLPLVTDQVALLGDSVQTSGAQSLALAVAAEVLGEERPAQRRPWFADALASSPFSDLELIEVEVERTWTADTLIGLAYSTSVASPARLGGRRAEFERRLRERVGDEEIRERTTSSAVLGRRRDQ